MGTLVEYVPVRSAAKLLGVSVQRVHQLLGAGKLMGRKMDATWLVSMRSIKLRYDEQHRGGGDGRTRR